ncbi:MAG TPA: hypothetical protein DCE56_29430 [Cyanobacteria bacterium UBA8553]|nr:hypothetical protein [Cyanobacteria bacterium UBA8553]
MNVDFQNQEISLYDSEISAAGKGAKGLKKALSPSIGFEAKASWKPNIPRPEGSIPLGPQGFYHSPPPSRHRFWTQDEHGNEKFNSPFTSEFLGIKVSATVHECGVDVSVSAAVTWLQLPEHGLHYRRPGECRRDPEPPKQPAPPPTDLDGYNPPPFKAPSGFLPDDRVIAVIFSRRLSKGSEFDRNYEKWYGFSHTEENSVEDITYPGKSLVTKPPLYPTSLPAFVEAGTKLKVTSVSERNKINRSETLEVRKFIHPQQQTYRQQYGSNGWDYRESELSTGPTGNQPDSFIRHGRFGDIFSEGDYKSEKIVTSTQNLNRVDVIEYQVAWCYKVDDLNNPWRKNPPINFRKKKKEEECCMTCCSSNKDQNNDALLREILQRVKNTEKRLGANDYPFSLPKSLIKQSEGWLSSLLPPEKKQINNTQEFIRHLFLTVDELFGEFEIPIEIKDSDPTTPGEQPKGIKIFNVAEGISELAGLGITSSINSETAINMLSRILYELAALRQMGADTNSKSGTLIDFFGFKTKESQENIRLTFTPGKDRLDETLKETEHPITVTVFDDKKQTYKHDLAKLLEAAAIIKGVHTRRGINLTDSTTAAAGIAKIVRELKKNKEKQDETLKKDLEDMLDKAIQDFEQGYISLPGIDDSANPYGEPYGNRPRVIRLDKQQPKGD